MNVGDTHKGLKLVGCSCFGRLPLISSEGSSFGDLVSFPTKFLKDFTTS